MTTAPESERTGWAETIALYLQPRVLNLQKHFGQASEDVAQILTSADKVAKRGGRIETLEFEEPQGRLAVPVPLGGRAAAE